MKTLYYNGNIITMAGDIRPQAVLCEDGKIAAVGRTESLILLADRLFDLQGKTMLPAFIDGHSHITTVANTFAIADLSHATSVEEIISIMKNYLSSREFPHKDEFVVGFGYDNNFFADKAHPSRRDLDRITTEYPVIISHSSGHMGVCNSKRLQLMGLDESTPDPQGGRIGRYPDGSPDGFLEETAFTDNTKVVKQPGYEDMCRYFDAAQKEFFIYGINKALSREIQSRVFQLLYYTDVVNLRAVISGFSTGTAATNHQGHDHNACQKQSCHFLHFHLFSFFPTFPTKYIFVITNRPNLHFYYYFYLRFDFCDNLVPIILPRILKSNIFLNIFSTICLNVIEVF